MALNEIPRSLWPDMAFLDGLHSPAADTTEADATSLLSDYIAAKQQIDRLRKMLGCQPEHNLDDIIAGLLASHTRLNTLADIMREVIDG